MDDVNCDSQYKFMGPHLGVLYAKYDLLDRLRAYKVRPHRTIRRASMRRGRRTTRTQFVRGRDLSAGIAGTLAAVNYLAGLGEQYGRAYEDRFPGSSSRRLHLKTGMTVLREYDHVLSAAILDELETLPGGCLAQDGDGLVPIALRKA